MIIGIDVGGTNVDGVIIDNKKILREEKFPFDKNKLTNNIISLLKSLTTNIDLEKIERINMSTTISTNAIVEKKLEDVLMVIQEGPGMVNNFQNAFPYLESLSGYVDHRGKVVKDLDESEIHDIIINPSYKKISSLAIVTKFSTRNPDPENNIYKKLMPYYKYISLGHKMSGLLNFPRRVNSAYLNSAVSKVFIDFIFQIEKAITNMDIKAPIYILKADGGTMSIKEGKEKPIESILSGPAASFLGISALESIGQDGLYIDIGGTTSDLFFLVEGKALYEPLGLEIKNMKTLVNGIYSRSLGLGGDSTISIVNKNIQIGPERKDRPLVLGGKYPTLTDAAVVLGLCNLGDKSLAEKGLRPLAEKFNLNLKDFSNYLLEEAANMLKKFVDQLIDEINSKPLYTVKEVLENRSIDIKVIKVIGGPAEFLRPYIEKAFAVKTLVPNNYLVANAIGAALARPSYTINLHGDTKRGFINIPEENIYKNISASFSLDDGISIIKNLLEERARKIGLKEANIDILEASSFNMIDYYSYGKNIRIKAQLRPGLEFYFWEDENGKEK